MAETSDGVFTSLNRKVPRAEVEQLRFRGPRRLHPDIPLPAEPFDPLAFIVNINVAAETERKKAELMKATFKMMQRTHSGT